MNNGTRPIDMTLTPLLSPEELGHRLYDFCKRPPSTTGVEHIHWTIPILLIDTRSLEACITYYRTHALPPPIKS